jgi:hypothetical protein
MVPIFWLLLGGVLLAASKAAKTGSKAQGLLLLAAMICVVLMFVSGD